MATSTSYVLDHNQILQAAEPERPKYTSNAPTIKVVSPGKQNSQQILANGAPSPSNKLSPRHIMSILNSAKAPLDVGVQNQSDQSQVVPVDENEMRRIKKASPKTFTQLVGSSRVMAVQREASGKSKKVAEPSAEELESQRKQRAIRRNSIGSMLTSSFRRSPNSEVVVKDPSPNHQSRKKTNGHRAGNFHTVSGAKSLALVQQMNALSQQVNGVSAQPAAPVRTQSARGTGNMVDVNFRNPFEEKKASIADDDASSQGSLEDSDSTLSSPVTRNSPRAAPTTSDGEQQPADERKQQLSEEESRNPGDNDSEENSGKEDAEAEVSALKLKLAEMQQQMLKKDEETKRLEGRLKESQACAKEYENAYKKLNDANTKLHEVNESLTSEVKSLKGSLGDSKLELGSLRAQFERLERECKNVKRSLSSLCGERDSLKLSLDNSLRGQEIAKKEVSALRTIWEDVKSRCSCDFIKNMPELKMDSFFLSQEMNPEQKEKIVSTEFEIQRLKDEVSSLLKKTVELESFLAVNNEQSKDTSSSQVDIRVYGELERKFSVLKKVFEIEKSRCKSLAKELEEEKMAHFAEVAQHKQHLGHLQSSIRKMELYIQQHIKEVQVLVQLATSEEKDDLCNKASELQELAEKCSTDLFGHQKLTFKGGAKVATV